MFICTHAAEMTIHYDDHAYTEVCIKQSGNVTYRLESEVLPDNELGPTAQKFENWRLNHSTVVRCCASWLLTNAVEVV
jgi:hypothetical protein